MRTRPTALAAVAITAALALTTAGTGPATAAPTTTGTLTSLGVPLSDVLLIGATVAPGPGGKNLLWAASSGAPAHLNAVDPDTGDQVVRVPLPGADGAYAVAAAPDGSIYVGSYDNGHLYRLRPGATAVDDLGTPLPGETYLWRIAIDDHGVVYGGTTYGGKVFSYDPATGAVRDYGQLVPGQTYVRSIAVWGGKVYAGTQADPHLVELDPVTGAKRELPLPDGTPPTGQAIYDLNAFDGYLYARVGGSQPGPLSVWDIAAGRWITTIPNAYGLDVSAPNPATGEVYLIAAGNLCAYNPHTNQLERFNGTSFTGRIASDRGIGLTQLADPAYPGPSVVGLLWRGDMFRYNLATSHFAIMPTKLDREPIDILSLATSPDGTVWAGGYLNGGVAAVDPDSGAATFHRFSQTEAILPAGGALYLGTYPDARVYRYDPTQPWSSPEYSPGPPGTPDNPVRLLNSAQYVQNRARALALSGHTLAVGTVPSGDTLGGMLALIDTTTGNVDVHLEPVVDQSVASLAARHGVVYGSTWIYGGLGSTQPTQTEGKLFAWDLATDRKLWEATPIAGAEGISSIAFDDRGRLWGVADGTLFRFDTRHRTVRQAVHLLPAARSFTTSQIAVAGRHLYVGVQGTAVFEVDPRTGHARKLVDHTYTRIVAGPDGALYLSDGPELLRYRHG